MYPINPISNVSSVYPIEFSSARTSAISATDGSRTARRTSSGTCAPVAVLLQLGQRSLNAVEARVE